MLAVFGTFLARTLRVPALVLFLGPGMLLGSDGPGGIYFDNAQLAQTIGVVGLVAILFEGGLSADWRDIRPIALSASLLGTVGVLVMAAAVGVAARYLLDLPWIAALLLGAIVGSTDAAAVFSTLRSTSVRRPIASLLEAESGVNDPMAVALTMGLLAWLTDPTYGLENVVLLLVRQLGLGALIGIGFGLAASRILPRLPADLAPFGPVASVAIAGVSYGFADVIGGSGFLAVYVVALMIGNTPMAIRGSLIAFHEGLAFVAQVALFIVLGLLVFPSRLPGVAAAAIGLTLVLILVARPIAVLASLPFQGFDLREKLFVSWAGLRGAVPIVLATFALSRGIPESGTIFNAVFFVVMLSALAQGLPLSAVAERLGLSDDPPPPLVPPEIAAIPGRGADVLEYRIHADDVLAGGRVRDSGLPLGSVMFLVVREGAQLAPRGSTRLKAGDVIYVMAEDAAHRDVEAAMASWSRGARTPRLPPPSPSNGHDP